jgi:hypothetical protein
MEPIAMMIADAGGAIDESIMRPRNFDASLSAG